MKSLLTISLVLISALTFGQKQPDINDYVTIGCQIDRGFSPWDCDPQFKAYDSAMARWMGQKKCYDDTTFHVQGETMVLKGYESIIDAKSERAIGLEWTDFKDGSEPGMYWRVQYDYGTPPPMGTEMIKWFLLDSFPKCYHEWEIIRETKSNSGQQEPEYFWWAEQVSVYCPTHKSLLPKYTYNIFAKIDKVDVTQNKDTTDKYIKLAYPELNISPKSKHSK